MASSAFTIAASTSRTWASHAASVRRPLAVSRILQTRLTAKGRRTLAACDAHVREVEAAMVKALDAKQRKALRQSLLSCIHSLHGGLEDE